MIIQCKNRINFLNLSSINIPNNISDLITLFHITIVYVVEREKGHFSI